MRDCSAGREIDSHLFGNVAREFILQSQHIPHVALVGLSPQVGVAARIDELGGDPDSVTGARHRPFYHGIDTQFARDLGQGLLCSFVSLNRSMGDDPESAKLGEISDQLVRHAIAEVLLLGIVRKVMEWQDRQGLDSVAAQPWPPAAAKMVPVQSNNEGGRYYSQCHARNGESPWESRACCRRRRLTGRRRYFFQRPCVAQRGDEPVSSLRQRLQKSWLIGIIAEHGADLPDGKVQPLLIIDKRLRSPYLIGQLLTCDNLPGMPDEYS